MESVRIEATENNPLVILDVEKNHIEFEGDSRPEDVRKFYLPILNWLDNYHQLIAQKVTENDQNIYVSCSFRFEYFNSSSAKYIMDIIDKLGNINNIKNTIKLTINWYYDEMDDDMLDAGQELEDIVGIKFNYVTIE